jgi:hypothetical protein
VSAIILNVIIVSNFIIVTDVIRDVIMVSVITLSVVRVSAVAQTGGKYWTRRVKVANSDQPRKLTLIKYKLPSTKVL